MYVFETGSKVPVETFLTSVHDAMKIRYGIGFKQDKNDAKILQTFLQDLKNGASNGNNFTNSIIGKVLEKIKSNHSSSYPIDKLFKRRGGQNLENELTDIIIACYELAMQNQKGFQKIDRKTINIGSDQSYNTLSAILSDDINAILKDMDREVKKSIDNEGNIVKGVTEGNITVNIYPKTDVKGLNLDLNNKNLNYDLGIKTNPEFMTILKILNSAKISAKNYSSVNKYGKMIEDLYDIHLGNSNPYRAVVGSLSSLGYGNITTSSAFYAAYNKYDKEKNENVGLHIYHLRFIYELTGAGLVDINTGEHEGVNFLIYNDPSGNNIYVKSASQILTKVLSQNKIFENPFKDSVNIKRKFFKNN